jgi:hypothetical protein
MRFKCFYVSDMSAVRLTGNFYRAACFSEMLPVFAVKALCRQAVGPLPGVIPGVLKR